MCSQAMGYALSSRVDFWGETSSVISTSSLHMLLTPAEVDTLKNAYVKATGSERAV